ncbi:MAG: DUF2797 domain-containing protein [Pseudomonadota bacterium]
MCRTDLWTCPQCGVAQVQPQPGGLCRNCRETLARADHCFVAPVRCHHAAGTCRDESFAAQVCMQPHVVYLAVTSGPKVGITRAGREWRRWLDQGASRALRIMRAPTRRAAGWAEAALARHLNDRTDWRKMLFGTIAEYDLLALAQQLRRDGLAEMPHDPARIPTRETRDVVWDVDDSVTRIAYPTVKNASAGTPGLLNAESLARIPARRLRLQDEPRVNGTLLGVRGGYLLLSGGVFHVDEHRGYEIELISPVDVENRDAQMSLF